MNNCTPEVLLQAVVTTPYDKHLISAVMALRNLGDRLVECAREGRMLPKQIGDTVRILKNRINELRATGDTRAYQMSLSLRETAGRLLRQMRKKMREGACAQPAGQGLRPGSPEDWLAHHT